ncbi:ribonuclease H-like domain-containing protein [Mycena filopes]|nr:ribonuclease H-like domain-containing protein [Mycena filopes]
MTNEIQIQDTVEHSGPPDNVREQSAGHPHSSNRTKTSWFRALGEEEEYTDTDGQRLGPNGENQEEPPPKDKRREFPNLISACTFNATADVAHHRFNHTGDSDFRVVLNRISQTNAPYGATAGYKRENIQPIQKANSSTHNDQRNPRSSQIQDTVEHSGPPDNDTRTRQIEPRPPGFEHLEAYELEEPVLHLTTETEVDDALAPILNGVIGFDAEFVERTHTVEELIIERISQRVGGNKKAMMLAWQLIQIESTAGFNIKWEHIAPHEKPVIPQELRRVLTSPDILKAGVGLGNNISFIWRDFAIELVNLVDVGCMARLLLVEQHADQGYSNLSLQTSAAEILGVFVGKEESTSNWKGETGVGDLTTAQLDYAGIDASVSLKLYQTLEPALEDKQRQLRITIPRNWYSMNTKYGEPTRKFPTRWGETLPWSVKDCYWYHGNKFAGYT